MQEVTIVEEHPNAAFVRRSLQALNIGDVESLMGLIDDDVEWHEIGRADPIRGKEALAQRFTGMDGAGFEFSGDVHDVVANDDHTVALVETTAKRADGRSLTYRTAEIMHVRDGKVTARWAFSDDTAAINEFFA
jgi:ketosteroid isomerase-like protein